MPYPRFLKVSKALFQIFQLICGTGAIRGTLIATYLFNCRLWNNRSNRIDPRPSTPGNSVIWPRHDQIPLDC